jgi:hypothetical protein
LNRFTVLLIAPLAMLAACETTVEVTGMLGVDEALTGSMTHYDAVQGRIVSAISAIAAQMRGFAVMARWYAMIGAWGLSASF